MQLLGAAILAGIGFTMSLFIGMLAFPDPDTNTEVRFGVLAGSLLSPIVGYIVLSEASRSRQVTGAKRINEQLSPKPSPTVTVASAPPLRSNADHYEELATTGKIPKRWSFPAPIAASILKRSSAPCRANCSSSATSPTSCRPTKRAAKYHGVSAADRIRRHEPAHQKSSSSWVTPDAAASRLPSTRTQPSRRKRTSSPRWMSMLDDARPRSAEPRIRTALGERQPGSARKGRHQAVDHEPAHVPFRERSGRDAADCRSTGRTSTSRPAH